MTKDITLSLHKISKQNKFNLKVYKEKPRSTSKSENKDYQLFQLQQNKEPDQYVIIQANMNRHIGRETNNKQDNNNIQE